jgi:hypothetical protein
MSARSAQPGRTSTVRSDYEDAVAALDTLFRRLEESEEERRTADRRLNVVCESLINRERELVAAWKQLDDIAAVLGRREGGDA